MLTSRSESEGGAFAHFGAKCAVFLSLVIPRGIALLYTNVTLGQVHSFLHCGRKNTHQRNLVSALTESLFAVNNPGAIFVVLQA